MADDRESNCFDDRTVSTADTERCLLNFDSTNPQYLQLNGDRLTWTSDLESLKKFVGKDLQQQGKWTSPGGNSKQFKSDNNNLVINWYNKKQLTLSFQGRDGPLLKDKLAELVLKKPGEKSDSLDLDSFSSIQCLTSSLTVFEANNNNQQPSAAEAKPKNSSQERSKPAELVAEIEGIKLDLLILQKKVEANSSLLSTNCQSQEENSLRAELLDYKERCEQLIMTICIKDKIVEDLEEKCLSLENRAATLAQENDSLRLALNIIIQEKSEGKYHHQKADQCWHQVENSRMKVGSADRCQRNATINNIVTRNSFEPLGDDTQVDVRNEINCNTNREDKNSRRPSCSQKKRTSNRSGPMEPPSEPEQMQSIRRKEIIITTTTTNFIEN